MRQVFLVLLLSAPFASLRADFTYQETTQITGGALFSMMRMMGPFARRAREPIVSTHLIKGNRMATVTKNHISVVDLDQETITNIDLDRQTYSVMTFAEMKQVMENAAQSMQQRTGKDSGDPNVDANFKVSAKATGQDRSIQGLDAKEIIISMEMEGTNTKTGESGALNISTDTWLASVPGYDEVKAFHRKMAEKMGYGFGSSMPQMGMSRPDVSKGFEEVAKEMAKLDGVPVESTIKMTGSGTGSDSSQASDQRSQQQAEAPPDNPAAALGRLAGFGGFGRRKKKDEAAKQDQSQQDAASSSASLIEMTTQLTNYASGAVDASKFEIPAGFKQVQPELRRGAQQK
jgi:hypothetical protein